MKKPGVIIDGNEAVADAAYVLNAIIAIYPITPSSPMREWSDQWHEEGRKNIWGARAGRKDCVETAMCDTQAFK